MLFIYMVNAEKYKDDQTQSKFYIDQITKTKKEIKDFNQNNIDANYSVAINDRLQILGKL
ncbi:hypothetical protein KA037_01490 [Patescibacteria group bacterium]|nr:hypothetical protein [Patescibacteria group bacterium]MBP7841336.1 hypothetical protein [Patescibacteria group bacterium]